MPDNLWEVTGGTDTGGILIRDGREINSPKLTQRLATGAHVRELELTAQGRLHFQRVSGDGPDEGWASVKIGAKDLLVRLPAESTEQDTGPAGAGADATDSARTGKPAPLGRKIRILALHGGGSNSNIMKYQTLQLKKRLGDKAEWDFLDGEEDPGKFGIPPDDFMKALAKDLPFRNWYTVEFSDDGDRTTVEKLMDSSVIVTYDRVYEGAERVLKYIKSSGLFDIVLGFSQGCIITHLMTGILREREEAVPWRLSVLFNGMRIRDNRYSKLCEPPFTQPSVMVFGRQDDFYQYGRESQAAMYEDPLIFEHEEGHKFPTRKPACEEIYDKVSNEILWRCGI